MTPRLPTAFLRAPIAHRGYHDLDSGRPENSRAAVTAAIAAGYGIEIDVQLSADGQAMVFHDDALGRLTVHTGRVREHRAEDLQEMRLLGTEERIATLPDILDLVGGRAALLIEIKDQDGALGPGVGPLERAVAAALDGYDGPAAVMSFNPHAAALAESLMPERAIGLVTCGFRPADWQAIPEETLSRLREIHDAPAVSFISHEAGDLDRRRVAELKAEGLPVLCWTIRSAEDEATARRVADNITFEGYAPGIPAA